MGQPLVSVIVTTYNYSHYIRDALQSVLAQTYPHFEVIVVDDGSHDVDETRRIIAELDDDRVRLIAKPQHEGISAARNEGISVASGQFLAFLDADDMFLPDKLRIQVNVLQKHAELGMVYSDEYLLGVDGKIQNTPVQAGKGGTLPSGFIAPEFIVKSFIATFTVLLRRSMIEIVGLFDTHLPQNEDDEFWLRVMFAGPVSFSPYVSGVRRVHSGNTSKNRQVMVLSQCATFAKLAQQRPNFVHQYRGIIQRRICRLALRYVLGQIRRRQHVRLSVLRRCAETHALLGRVGAPT